MEEHKQRLNNIKSMMNENDIDVAIIHFFADIYYFSGTNQLSTLIVPLNSDPVLFVKVGFDIATKESRIPDIRELKGMSSLKKIFAERNLNRATIGINEDTVPLALFKRYNISFPDAKFVNISPIIQSLRLIKSEGEIALIEKSAEVSLKGHRHAMKNLAEGITELEFSAEVEFAIRRAGHAGCTFHRRGGYSLQCGIVGPSGPNLGYISGSGAITNTGKGLNRAVPMGASKRRICKGDMVEVDLGVNVEGYHSDEARMYCIGNPDHEKRSAYDAVFNAYNAVLDIIRPGIMMKDLYFAARKVFEKSGYLDYFAGYARYPQYSFLGHGIGLEINEPPLITSDDETILMPNMTIALEPKIIAPNIGVTFEDTIVITENGYRLLTKTDRKLFIV